MEVPPALLQLFDDQEEARRALKAAAAPIEPATLSSLPAQAYLEATVIPILLQGLDALAVARQPEGGAAPADPWAPPRAANRTMLTAAMGGHGQLAQPGMPPGAMGGLTPSPFMAQLGLPPAIMALFAPRPPLPYKKPLEKRKLPGYIGAGAYVALFETEKPADLPPYRPPETKRQKKERVLKQKK
eukprot:gene9734-15110_t